MHVTERADQHKPSVTEVERNGKAYRQSSARAKAPHGLGTGRVRGPARQGSDRRVRNAQLDSSATASAEASVPNVPRLLGLHNFVFTADKDGLAGFNFVAGIEMLLSEIVKFVVPLWRPWQRCAQEDYAKLSLKSRARLQRGMMT